MAEEKPVFNFDDLSWADSKELSLAQTRIRTANAAGDIEGLISGFADMQRFLARVVVSIPRDWLVNSAPEQIDWSDSASFDLLKAKRMRDVLKLLDEAQEPAEVSKN